MKRKELSRLLIEDWLPAAAIGVESKRERSTGQNPPNARLHVWWARRPLTASRAAILASLLPADFPHDVFERVLGFGKVQVDWDKLRRQKANDSIIGQLTNAMSKGLRSQQLVAIQKLMDSGVQVGGFGCDRAFNAHLREDDVAQVMESAKNLWGGDIRVLDPMAGGGSIPLEARRFGFYTMANELNPVACSLLEATLDYPFRLGAELGEKSREWADKLRKRFNVRMERFFPKRGLFSTGIHIFAHTVPCPDTRHSTPLIPDWHILRPKDSEYRLVAEPIVDVGEGIWSVRFRELGSGRGKIKTAPRATYVGGKGISLFTGSQIPAEYIKAKAQAGQMGSALYAIEIMTPKGPIFASPADDDFAALEKAKAELAKHRPRWESAGIIPTERIPVGAKTTELISRGIVTWAGMFTPRQLLGFGVLVEELQKLRSEILEQESKELGEGIIHLLSLATDKFLNYNSVLCSWHAPRGIIRSVFDRHDFSFKATFAEMAPCSDGTGLDWAINSTLTAFEDLCSLPSYGKNMACEIMQGSATNLPSIKDKSITAVVVDPPYADNVQYSELADFFYVWLKRTQGYRRPEWFSTYLCDHSEEAVANAARFKTEGIATAEAKKRANEFYQRLMADSFREAFRILRDDGILTVMFTHKKQAAWEALFTSLIDSGFSITATWPVKTESEFSLHQAKKNAAQSTVILVARKRPDPAEIGLFDQDMRSEIRLAARNAAERLQHEGLNPVDQLVGSFGPAIEVYSRYKHVKTDTGERIGVEKAIDEASEAVAAYRIELLAKKGLQGVEGEAKFYLLCWNVMQAAEFRFNEAMLLGKAVGMDVDTLIAAGLVTKLGDKINIVPAKDRRRSKRLDPDEIEQTLFGPSVKGKKKRARKSDVLMIHPNDARFRTTLDACHALALRHIESGGERMGIGAAKQLAAQQQWKGDSAVARLMEALIKAAPEGVRFPKKKGSAAVNYPEFSAWHSMLKPVFGIDPPEWKEELLPLELGLTIDSESEDAEGEDEEKIEE